MRICQRCGACFEDDFDLCAYDGGLLAVPFTGPRVLGERYLLEQRLAQGAMGIIFRATHLQVGNTVAVKLMQPRKEELQVALARFHREAQILGQVKHPNAVLVMDFGVEERAAQQVPYLVTEFLRGESLDATLERNPRLPLTEALRVLAPLCDAVEEAHHVGVVHRDIKPSNVFLERLRDGSEIVKVLDFGIAKFVELSEVARARLKLSNADTQDGEDVFAEEVAAVRENLSGTVNIRAPRAGGGEREGATGPEQTLTEAGFMVGTLSYMAPEQVSGGRVSRATDIYAVGTLLYRMLSGELPFRGTDEEVMEGKLTGDFMPLQEQLELPARLAELVHACLQVQPADRPQSAREVAERMDAALRRPSSAAPATSTLVQRALELCTSVEHALADWDAAADMEEPYGRARDGILALDAHVSSARRNVESATHAAVLSPAAADAIPEMERALNGVASALMRLGARGGASGEFSHYLTALWSRLQPNAHALLGHLRENARASSGSGPLPALFDGGNEDARTVLTALAERLLSKEPLEAAEGVEDALAQHTEALLAWLARGTTRKDALCESLVRGLWRHADILALRELYPLGHRVRLLPTLSRLDRVAAAAPFALLARLFAQPDPAELAAVLARPAESVEADEPDRVLRRCLLLHPRQDIREAAAAAIAPSDCWNVAVHPRVPVHVLELLFSRLSPRVPQEFLKVFFLCARERLASASSASELTESFRLLERFLTVPSFHEDLVFEPLLQLDALLRARATEARVPVPRLEQYADALSTFAAEGSRESQPMESFTSIPLPIQRLLARQGHFLIMFACHNNERVARETLPHIVRQEDIVKYLRLPTIHRAVLTELSRHRRFFRQDAARLALLSNPKCPAPVARVYLPFVPHEQLRFLAHNRHIGAEVRVQVNQHMARLPK